MGEIWKITKENKNYSISNYGNVRRSDTKKVLSKIENHNGYYVVHFCKGKDKLEIIEERNYRNL